MTKNEQKVSRFHPAMEIAPLISYSQFRVVLVAATISLLELLWGETNVSAVKTNPLAH
jgi:hypothetical protein